MEGIKSEIVVQNPAENTVLKTSPWGVTAQHVVPCSLSAVMDEELARTYQKQEENAITTQTNKEDTEAELSEFLSIEDGLDTSNDLLLAQMLQLEFDKEHDLMLTKEERHYNKDSKVQILFNNYRTVHPAVEESDDDSDDLEESLFFPATPSALASKKGYIGQGKNITTKHDAATCGRRNASRVVEQFPPSFQSGDSLGMDMKLSNRVYNSLKKHSKAEEKKAQKIADKKEHSTVEQAVDPKTRLLLYKLVNNEILDSINGIISTGKESVVIHANGGQAETQLVPEECALKVFKTTLNEFRTRDKYIKDDFRFKDRFSKLNPRKIIRMWAEKEMHNLNRMRSAGICCPDVILLKKHILVLSFIGEDRVPAPKLKDVQLSTADMKVAYEQCVQMMETMYNTCNLIHADLSEYNMLWFKGQVCFIDVSQSVEPTHPLALEFLLRDCTNVSKFFTSRGLQGILKPHELFNKVTSLDIDADNEKEFMAQIEALQEKRSVEKTMTQEENFAFEYFFEKTRNEEMKESHQTNNVTENDEI
ncbi:serine/threonine-protein kinase RIO3-like [Anneissia japonica]|uniref:serine/threonine-protein kinase RIO3-like n=1 Tax=Anneissia japonica TaxID=1529436 RepID=UPI0014255284|nr:serine/threonine-protein kinase RIO3-like [Anneissia japonica]